VGDCNDSDRFQSVIEDAHTLDGVAVHCWDKRRLVVALVKRSAIDDVFDRLRTDKARMRRLTKPQGNALVKNNLDAFSHIVVAKHGEPEHMLVSAAGLVRPAIVIDYVDIERSGEKLSGEAITSWWKVAIPDNDVATHTATALMNDFVRARLAYIAEHGLPGADEVYRGQNGEMGYVYYFSPEAAVVVGAEVLREFSATKSSEPINLDTLRKQRY
jgi:hypothetical protein